MNLKTITFLTILFFILGMVLGLSLKKPTIINNPTVSTVTIRDTIIKIQSDTIKISVDRVKYFTKTDTVIVKNTPVLSDSFNCVSFPLLLSDSSTISVTECSKEKIPTDLTFDARYIDKRERIKIIEKLRIDTIKQSPKRLGFTIGPSVGIGIDINNLERPAYFVGVTLTYGLRL
jgi:hypothetical protein